MNAVQVFSQLSYVPSSGDDDNEHSFLLKWEFILSFF